MQQIENEVRGGGGGRVGEGRVTVYTVSSFFLIPNHFVI